VTGVVGVALSAPYFQRALAELLLLAMLAGVLGSWIVLRRLAFYTHAVGTATFPGLVVAVPWGVSPQLAALAVALGFSAGLERISRVRRIDPGAATGLLLVAALAIGIVLASDVYGSGAGVDRLLFGSLIGTRARDVWLTAGAVVLALAAHVAFARTWLVGGFEGASRRTALADRVLLAAVAVAVVVSLDAVGALLVAVVLVVPAATARLVTTDVRSLQLGTAVLAAAEGVTALVAADALNVGPGPAMAVIGGLVYALVAAIPRAAS
jgi:ABC-type Mn2+/Zn2+ transport system permease subunit